MTHWINISLWNKNLLNCLCISRRKYKYIFCNNYKSCKPLTDLHYLKIFNSDATASDRREHSVEEGNKNAAELGREDQACGEDVQDGETEPAGRGKRGGSGDGRKDPLQPERQQSEREQQIAQQESLWATKNPRKACRRGR